MSEAMAERARQQDEAIAARDRFLQKMAEMAESTLKQAMQSAAATSKLQAVHSGQCGEAHTHIIRLLDLC